MLKELVKEFEDYNVCKLIVVLSIVDNLIITLAVGGLQDVLNKTDTLREKVLYLISFKQFVKVILNLIDQFECDNYFKEIELYKLWLLLNTIF